MKLSGILPLAALSSAFVLPNQEALSEVAIESNAKSSSFLERVKDHPLSQELQDTLFSAIDSAENALDHALDTFEDYTTTAKENFWDSAFAAKSWIGTCLSELEDLEANGGGDEPPHHGPPHHGPPHHGPPHHGPPGKHHPGHGHGKPNMTIYELISKSKYTTKLAKLIEDDEDLIKVLNSTSSNHTIFAPTDAAFEKIPDHAHKPSKEIIKKVLLYHIAPGLYPAGRVLHSYTIPTLFESPHLGQDPLPQRLSVKFGLKGLTLNFYSRIVAVNIVPTNGIIHGVDSILIPPPPTLHILNFLPTEFSTLLLGLGETGLIKSLNETAKAGGTFFAPSNLAFKKLGPKINGFLFSPFGRKYLKALLEYHVVLNQTLYSDAYYDAKGKIVDTISEESANEVDTEGRGYFHVDLPTLLKDKSLAVDVLPFGPWITIKINGFSRVVVPDGIAADGVIQVVGNVLIPPKSPGGPGGATEELTVEDLKKRLEPFVEEQSL
ncbi:FAS1 domain-containing protein, partial [Aulographum hederae CBS 113979]